MDFDIWFCYNEINYMHLYIMKRWGNTDEWNEIIQKKCING